MHILCTICSDLVNQAESIYVTKCGHLFHYQCLAQWIERSKSCPQCRHKVTEKCMFRIYPTISNDNSDEDVTKVQSRLDDALLQLRQYKASCNTLEAKITELTTNLKSNGDLLRKTEKHLINKEAVISTMKQQWEFFKIQLKNFDKMEKDNEELKKNIETMKGLQKVLNATSDDVEEMLKDYGDLRTIATFAAALKRALLESESRKAETRSRLQLATQELAEQRAELRTLQKKLLQYEREQEILKKKRKAAEGGEEDASGGEDGAVGGEGKRARSDGAGGGGGGGEADVSFGGGGGGQEAQLHRAAQAESPYLRLRRGALPGPVLLPSEYALLKYKGAPPAPPARRSGAAAGSDGRGGRARPGSAPAPAPPARRAGTGVGAAAGRGGLPRNQHSIFYKKPPLGAGAGAGAGGGGAGYDGLGGRARPDSPPAPAPSRIRPPRLSARPRLRPPAPRSSQNIAVMLQNTPTKTSAGTS